MADTDQQPTQGTKRMGQGIDWRGLAQWGGGMLAVVSISVCAWVHGMLLGYGDRLTKLEERGEAAKSAREQEAKQSDKQAESLEKAITDLRASLTAQMQSLDQRQNQMAQGVTALQLDLVRATAGRANNGGMP